jgi:Lrp/AsnC family transcriptional regulator for asnA, asnC and gidA
MNNDPPRQHFLDQTDVLILSELLKDSKSALKKISRKLGLPTSTVFTRIKKLEEKGIIQGYTVVIDPFKLGYFVTAIIHFSVDGPYLEDVEKRLSSHPNIISLYDVTGEFDIIAIARFRSMEELDSFIKHTLKNPHIKRSITNMVLRIVKEKQPGVPIGD